MRAERRVLFISPWARREGGAENMLWTLVRQLDPEVVRAEVVFLEDGPFVDDVRALGIPVAVVPAGRLREPRSILRTVDALRRIIRTRNPDVVLAWSPKVHLYCAVAAALAGFGGVRMWWQHGIPRRDGWLDVLATALPADVVGTCSTTAMEAQRALRPRRRVVRFTPSAETRAPDPAVVARLREELAFGDVPVVGIVGRLEPWKGQHLVIDAFAAVRAAGVDARLLVIGGPAFSLHPTYEPALHAQVARLGLEDVVTFTGQVPDATPYLPLIDVFVNASDCEPFGLVFIEAMAAARAVVTRSCGGPADLFTHERDALLVDDDAQLAPAIERLCRDVDLRARLGEAARARFVAGLTVEHAARRFERLIREL